MDLNIAFSQSTQPLTLTSTDDSLEDGFTLFCAIATTTCEAFEDVPLEIKESGSHSSTKLSRPTKSNSEQVEPLIKRSRTVSAQPTKRLRLDIGGSQAVAVVRSSNIAIARTSQAGQEPALPSLQQAYDNSQPRLEGGGGTMEDPSDAPFPPLTQSRMTQQEVLDMSGLGDLQMDDLVDELDRAEEEEEMNGLILGGIDPINGISDLPDLGGGGEDERMFRPDLTVFEEKDFTQPQPPASASDKLEGLEDLNPDEYDEMPPSQREPIAREVRRLLAPGRILMSS